MKTIVAIFLFFVKSSSLSSSSENSCEEELSCPNGFVCQNRECVPCLEESVAYFGNNILSPRGPLQASDPEKCRDLCRTRLECSFWTFEISRELCYLKFSRGIPRKCEFFVSGSRRKCRGGPLRRQSKNTFFDFLKNLTEGLVLRRHRHQHRYIALKTFKVTGQKSLPKSLSPTIINATEKRSDKFSRFSGEDHCEVLHKQGNKTKDDLIALIGNGGSCTLLTKSRNINLSYKGAIILNSEVYSRPEKMAVQGLIKGPVVFLTSSETSKLMKFLSKKTDDNENYAVSLELIKDNAGFFSSYLPSIPKAFFRKQKHFASGTERRSSSLRLSSSISLTPLAISCIAVACILAVLTVISFATFCIQMCRERRRRRTQSDRMSSGGSNRLHFPTVPPLGGDWGRGIGFGRGVAVVSDGFNAALQRTTSKVLECPVCLDVAWPPKKIFQCVQGHIICENCKNHPRLKTCPVCRVSLEGSNATSRNLALETMAGILHNGQEATAGTITTEDEVPTPSAPPIQRNSDVYRHLASLTVILPEEQ